MDAKFLKPYNPKETEDKIYKLWEKSGFFNPDNLPKNHKEPYFIVMPPPNVTGTLHMGQAEMLAIEDILIRYNRMREKKTLWIPGTDHAAIATQSKVEKTLYKKERKTRHDFGMEKFLKEVEKFAQVSHDIIVNQIKKMGSSVDWSREAFTLDDKRSLAVRAAFKNMYDDGLIYRGERIVNWDPKMQTVVSDDEIERVSEKTTFYYLKYGPFIIGTARPETKFGDKYVVMHPKDTRYKKYKHREKIELEWINGPITATIIKDETVDMEFGTGVMTITPWHDTADFDIAQRHKLDREQIIDERGKLLKVAGEFADMNIKMARPLIVEKLKKKGLLEKTDENYAHNVAVNYRGECAIEPQIKAQWFVSVEKQFTIKKSRIKGIKSGEKTNLKEIMRAVVKSEQIEIIPERFKKTYFHWIDNLRDWCISRQIWYGHRIPVFYCGKKQKKTQSEKRKAKKNDFIAISSIEKPKKCPVCNECEMIQDPDTLDTWFSSGLWTFSTLGWPEETKDLKTYHPSSILETGYDILFFWVARMILMSGYHLGDIPFEKVYLHGLIRDAKGKKMSKTLDNIIDPLLMIEKYGADATRLSLIIGTAPGNDIKLSEDKIRGYKYFSNKLWNIARFILSNIEDTDLNEKPELAKENEEWLYELNEIIDEVTKDIDNYRFYLAGEKLYHYVWHTLADVIIEESKSILNGGDEKMKKSMQWTLYTILITSIKLLHPFTPFVTEEIWQSLPKKNKKLLMIENWPDKV